MNMANKLVATTIKHCGYSPYDNVPSSVNTPKEPDKNKSISELSRIELYEMLSRLLDERAIQEVLRQLKLNAGERETYEAPFEIDTKTPIKDLYHEDDSFAHFGIKGQKWGLRRFQNADGTRTAAGKKRYPDDRPKSDDHKESRSAKSKGLSGMSNDDLRKLNERLQLEDTFRKLNDAQIKNSKSWTKKVISDAGTKAATDFTSKVFLAGAKLMVQKVSPEFAKVAFDLKDKDTPKPGGR